VSHNPDLPPDLAGTVIAAADRTLEDAVDLLADLVAMPSTGGSDAEVGVQRAVADVLRSEGFAVSAWELDLDRLTAAGDFPGMEVERSAGLGVLATRAGGAPERGRSLLVDGHTDVVPPGDLDAWDGDPYALRRIEVDGRPALAGRGTCDMKAGLVAGIMAARAVQAAGLTLAGDLLVAPVSGEEDGGLGTYALLERGVRADACVVPEPTSLDIVPANGGALTFRLRVPGRATHASRRTEGVSALDKLLPVLEALATLESRRNADVHPLMRRWDLAYPLSIGTVAAGDWASTVPDLLVAEGRYGVALEETVAAARAELEAAVAEVNDADPFLREHPVTVEWWGGQFAPGMSESPELVDAVRRAHSLATGGAEQEVYGGPYGSDLRLLAPAMPTLQYGPGDARTAHAPDEHVTVEDLRTATRALALLYVAHCGLA
jgi:acetylornithine deacetylase